MHDDGVTHFLSILFEYPFGGGGGVGFRGFLCNIANDNCILLTLIDEIEYGVRDLGYKIRHIIIECSCLVSIFLG